jgi:cell division protein FtsZ
VTGGPDLTLFEVNQAAAIIKETAHPEVNLIFGAVIDQNMGDDVRVTVIATGFERSGLPMRRSVEVQKNPLQQDNPALHKEEASREMQPAEIAKTDFTPRTYNTEDLDIPTFLRNRIRS